MNLFDLNTKNEATILKSHKNSQLANMIVCSILAFASLVVTLYFMFSGDYYFEECLIPLGVHSIIVGIFFLIRNRLQIHYGMYYDMRMTRLAAENKNGKVTAVEDLLPEL